MKINVDGPRMTMKEENLGSKMAGGIMIVVGLVLALFLLNEILVVILGAALALLGIYLLLSSKSTTITIDKMSGKIRFFEKSTLKNENRELDLKKIRSMIIEKSVQTAPGSMNLETGSYANASDIYQYKLITVLDSGEEYTSNFERITFSSGMAAPDEAEFKKAKEVADFIGVPIKLREKK